MFYTRIEIPSNISNLIEIEDYIDSLMSECELPEQYRGIISAPLMEAAKNAIVHGNGSDRQKKVRIVCQQERKKLTFSVADEGDGFPFSDYEESGKQLETHGLSVIFSLCDKVCFQQNGSVIVFSIPVPKQQTLPKHNISLQTIASPVLQNL